MVVEGNVDVFGADALDRIAAISFHTVAGACETDRALDIEGQQIAGARVLVLLYRVTNFRSRIRPASAAGGCGSPWPGWSGLLRDMLSAPALTPQQFNPRHQLRRSGLAQACRMGTAVHQTLHSKLPIAPHPLGRRLRAESALGCRRTPNPTRLPTQHCTTTLDHAPSDVHDGAWSIYLTLRRNSLPVTISFSVLGQMDNNLYDTPYPGSHSTPR